MSLKISMRVKSLQRRVNEGECNAVKVLREMGLRILSRNRKINGVEIDIIARYYFQNEWHLTFLEVKQIRRKHFQAGYPILSSRQRERYQKAAKAMIGLNDKLLNLHCGLIVMDELGQLIMFNPFEM